MVETYQGNALCQAALLEGLSKGSERRLEDRIRHLLTSNGAEFVVDTLKVLKQHCIDNLDQPNPYSQEKYGFPYISWNRKLDKPKGGLGVIYTEFKSWPKRLRVIGAVINSISLDEPSAKQKKRFLDGVEYNRRTDESVSVTIHDYEVGDISRHLRSKIWSMDQFSGAELTASVVPEGTESQSLTWFKRILSNDRARSEDRAKAIAGMEAAFVNQWYTAPKASHIYVRDVLNPVREDGHSNITKLSYCKNPKPIKARPYDGGNRFCLHIEDYRPYVGTISMLQQPGAKLRTVVNVNRFVNYTMSPFAKALEDTFYRHPQIAVYDQEDGMKWAQEQLRAGRELASIDLSQATDLLDFRVLMRSIHKSVNASSALKETLNYFEYIAESPFFQPDLDIGVTLNTGQPLGLKGSFQVLTVMNYLAGREACIKAGLHDLPFRVVGDDIVIDSRAAQFYADIIESWSGKTNYEKMLTSSRYAEFCSHIITPSSIVSMKPKYVASFTSVYDNAEKSSVSRVISVYKLSKSDKSNIIALGEYGDPHYDNLPYVKHHTRASKLDRTILSKAKELYTLLSTVDNSTSVEVSKQSVDFALQEHPEVYTKRIRELDRSRYVRQPDGSKLMLEPSSVPGESRVYNRTVDRFNHETGRRDRVMTSRQALDSKRQDAKVLKALGDDLVKGVPSELPLPNHSNRSVSTTGILDQAIELVKHEQAVAEANKASQEVLLVRKPKHSLSDAQLMANLEQARLDAGLTEFDSDPDVDYGTLLLP